jgi:DNA-directed RNA polymerase specialized sigma subunit
MSNDNKPKFDRRFQELACQINQTIIDNDGLIGDQKEQVELMFSLERKFQFYIQKHTKTNVIYSKFIKYIVSDVGNILSARPYFRERSDIFSSKITSDLRNDRTENFANYKINYLFIRFLADNWGGPFPEKPRKYYEEYLEARRILIENNLPLAINRAKLFYRKTPRGHLDLLDLIDICVCGLINGIDKYVGEYTKVWRSVCIGRMVGEMIEEYSKTFVRLYPSDRKILYRANSLRNRLQIDNMFELVQAVNDSFQQDLDEGRRAPAPNITEVHLQTLMNGSGYYSASNQLQSDDLDSDNQDDYNWCSYDHTADTNPNVEEEAIEHDLLIKIGQAMQKLTVIERKIIRLKGVLL